VWGFIRIATALVAVAVNSPQSVVAQVLSVAGFTTGVILGLFLLGSLRRPVTSAAALAGLVTGFLVVLAVWGTTRIAWPWFAPIGAGTTVAVALVLNLFGARHGASADGGAQPRLDEPR
jgi:Na+/proline symporter